MWFLASVARNLFRLNASPFVSDKDCLPARQESKLADIKFFMRLACLTATRSRDRETKVGAVIVRNDREIVATGYNGFPQHPYCSKQMQFDNDVAFSWDKNNADPLKNKDLFVTHAEHNAILNSCDKDVRGCKLYVTLHPCNECAKFVINCGISEVIYHEDRGDSRYRAAKKMFALACPPVKCRSYSEALREAGAKCVADPTKFEMDETSQRPGWRQYFMAMAKIAAERSEDPRTKVGAVIVNANERVVGIGYNGMPNDCEQSLGCTWQFTKPKSHKDEGWLGTKYPYVVHAVQMAIMNKNSADLKGSKLYVTLFPDNDCAKTIIQSKIDEVIYLENSKKDNHTTKASKKMLKWAAIELSQFKPEGDIKMKLVDENISLVTEDIPCTGVKSWRFKSEPKATHDSAKAEKCDVCK